jgi:hypothetical protein
MDSNGKNISAEYSSEINGGGGVYVRCQVNTYVIMPTLIQISFPS